MALVSFAGMQTAVKDQPAIIALRKKAIGHGPRGDAAEKDHPNFRLGSAVIFSLAGRKNNNNMKIMIEKMEKFDFLQIVSLLFFGLSGSDIWCKASLKYAKQSIQVL